MQTCSLGKCIWVFFLNQSTPKYKEGKPWTGVATICSDEQFRAMTTLHTEGVITIAAEREIKQNKSEEQLLKLRENRPKTT